MAQGKDDKAKYQERAREGLPGFGLPLLRMDWLCGDGEIRFPDGN